MEKAQGVDFGMVIILSSVPNFVKITCISSFSKCAVMCDLILSARLDPPGILSSASFDRRRMQDSEEESDGSPADESRSPERDLFGEIFPSECLSQLSWLL